MATNCDIIDGNIDTNKCAISQNNSCTSMTHEEKQDAREKSQNSLSDTSSEVAKKASESLTHAPRAVNLHAPDWAEDSFEFAYEASMDDLEQGEIDGYETDTESDDDDDVPNDVGNIARLPGHCKKLPRQQSFEYHSSDSSTDSEVEGEVTISDDVEYEDKNGKPLNADLRYNDIFHSRPYLLPFMERRRLSQCKEEEDEDDADKSPQPQHPTDALSPLKFEKPSTSSAIISPPPPPPPLPVNAAEANAEKFKELERMRRQFMHKIENINASHIEEIKTTAAKTAPPPPPPPPIPPTILPPALINLLHSAQNSRPMIKAPPAHKDDKPGPIANAVQAALQPKSSPPSKPNIQTRAGSPETLIIKGKFTVTKAQESPDVPQLRSEAQNLKALNAKGNAYTISFPSSFGGYSSVQGLFSQRYGSHKFPAGVPHLSKEYFDTSMVEIRTPGVSTTSINESGTTQELSSLNPTSVNPRTKPLTAEYDEYLRTLEYLSLDSIRSIFHNFIIL